jgi:hypothetical protein
MYKSPINPVTNSNSVYTHAIKVTIFGKLTHTAAEVSLDSHNRPVCSGDIPDSIRSITRPNEEFVFWVDHCRVH